MKLTIQIENKEDYPFIKELLERLEGVKITSEDGEELIEGVPRHIYEAIDNYGANVKEEDCISEEEFFKTIEEARCRLYSRK